MEPGRTKADYSDKARPVAVIDPGSAVQIETVRSIDRNLALLFWVIATAGMAGYSLSLGASLWANTDRKRRELSVLRLLAFRGVGIMLYPSCHALFTAVLGWLGAVFVYLLLEQVMNHE